MELPTICVFCLLVTNVASTTVVPTTFISPASTGTSAVTATVNTVSEPATGTSPASTGTNTVTATVNTVSDSTLVTSTPVVTTTTIPPTTTEGTKSPEILNQPLDVNLLESARDQKQLLCIPCTDPDGAATEVKLTGILSDTNSTTTAGLASFGIWKDDGATEYCVYFIPGQGSISYTENPILILEVVCTDGIDPPTTADLSVRLQPNYSPEFSKTVVTVNVPNTKDKTKVDVLYKVMATDVTPGDNLTYSLTSSPDEGLFTIDPSSGEIKPTKDLSSVCSTTSSQLNVMVTDNFNDPVGPMEISLNLDDINMPPTLTNMNREILVGEHALADKKDTLYTIQHDDTFILNKQLQYTLLVKPPEYTAYFTMKNDDLMLLHDLNYEVQQSFNITVSPTDGYCPGSPYWIKIQVTDENDPIKLALIETLGNVDEGLITFDPNPQITDEDRLDKPVYSLTGNTQFTIDPSTGVVSSVGEYDMDGSNKGIVTLIIRATDKGGNYSEAKVTLNVDEINDNRPEVSTKSYLTESMTCSDPSDLGITLPKPSDDDKRGSINEEVDYIPQSSGPLTVTKDGGVYLTSAPKVGFYSVNVFAIDHGVKPEALTSAKSVTVSLIVTPCTTTPAPTTKKLVVKQPSVDQTPVQQVQKTNTVTQTADSSFDWTNVWIALGSVLGALLLGLLAYLLYKCCCAAGNGCGSGCGSGCSNGCCRRCCKYERAVTPVKNKVAPSPPPEKTKPGENDGELYDFWKEHYYEDDIIIEPNRYALPVTMGTR